MELTFTQLLSLFFIYSLAGWLLETAAAAIFKRQLINKGYLSLPLCPIYGVEAAAFTLFLSEQFHRLFLGGLLVRLFHLDYRAYSGTASASEMVGLSEIPV